MVYLYYQLSIPELSKQPFFDPEYRGVLDKLKFGNEGKYREKARCKLPQMDESIIKNFISEINRVLLPSGHLFLWVDKFHDCEGIANWFQKSDMFCVDKITWNKDKIGLGFRSRQTAEYLHVYQKVPKRAKGCWTDHSIRDVWTEKVQKPGHPHSKPVDLQRRLILATTKPGDVVLDPAAGGYSVFEACKLANRDFISCDIL